MKLRREAWVVLSFAVVACSPAATPPAGAPATEPSPSSSAESASAEPATLWGMPKADEAPPSAAALAPGGSAGAKNAGESPEALVRAWLALVDTNRYGDSWDRAAALFRHAINRPGWQRALASAREPLGKVGTRTLVSVSHASTLPGAPDGDYQVVKFKASFENRESALETVTLMKDDDGTMRVAGYFIR
jgi:hypothetical protein